MSPKAQRTSVFIADDHPLVRDALAEAVRRRADFELVGAAADGRAALEEIRRLEPDVAVLDLKMGDFGGGEVLRAIVRDGVQTRVLILSTYVESGTVYEIVATGASGYLDKGVPAQKICDAIASVARGNTVLSDAVEGGVLQQIRLRGADTGPRLTARELDVLRLIADGMSAPAIAKKLFLSPSTIKSHLQNLYTKLGVTERAAAVAEGMRRGLVE
jgi:two-component system nitrate/nitrite response regulator NarL